MFDIKLKFSGEGKVIADLRNIGETVERNARKVMHARANVIVKEAKLNAPEDTHALEDSIRKEVDYEYRGRLHISVVMGGSVDGVNVDAYAYEVHEHYSAMGVGPGTMAKRIANPGRLVGEKFLTRAAEGQQEALNMQ